MTADQCPKCGDVAAMPQIWTHRGRVIVGGYVCHSCDWEEADGQPCETCGVYVPTEEQCPACDPVALERAQ
jgi:predicted RNA-binding Zn-ribbon protein involved in translation (DUF1610 family)